MPSPSCVLGSGVVVIKCLVAGPQRVEAGHSKCPLTRQEAPGLALGQCSGSLPFILGPATELILQYQQSFGEQLCIVDRGSCHVRGH